MLKRKPRPKMKIIQNKVKRGNMKGNREKSTLKRKIIPNSTSRKLIPTKMVTFPKTNSKTFSSVLSFWTK